MSSTVVLQCACESVFQDEQYGYGWRLHNTNGQVLVGLRKACCTVCGDEKYKEYTTYTKDYVAEHSEWSSK